MMRDNLKGWEIHCLGAYYGINERETHPALKVSLIHYSSSYLIFTERQWDRETKIFFFWERADYSLSTENLKIHWLMYFSPGRSTAEAIPVCWRYPDTSEFQDIRKHADYMWYLSSVREPSRKLPAYTLNTRFVGIHPVRYPFGRFEWSIYGKYPFGIQYPVMVITISILQLYKIVVVDACPYRSRSAEIHRSTFYRKQSRLSVMCWFTDYNNRHPPSTDCCIYLPHHHRD